MDIISEIFEERLSQNDQYLDFLYEYYLGNQKPGSTIEIEPSNKDEQKVFDLLTDIKDKVAYKVGCTINVSGTSPLYQVYFVCKTCDKVANHEIKVCVCCARFCHAGHKLFLAQRGHKDNITCDCGMNLYNKLPINKRKNPLSKILPQKDILNKPDCCLKSKTASSVGKAALKLVQKHNNGNKKRGKKKLNMMQKLSQKKLPLFNKNSRQRNRRKNARRNKKIQEDSQDELNEDHASQNGDEDDQNDEGEMSADQVYQYDEEDEESKAVYEGGANLDQDDLQKYKFMLKGYSSEKFIQDLARAIKFDKSKIRRRCPELIKNKFTFTDLSLQRPVHIYEHIILLAHGYCRPGFLKLISNTELMTENEIKLIPEPLNCGQNPFYDALITFVSAFQGDLEAFRRH